MEGTVGTAPTVGAVGGNFSKGGDAGADAGGISGYILVCSVVWCDVMCADRRPNWYVSELCGSMSFG